MATEINYDEYNEAHAALIDEVISDELSVRLMKLFKFERGNNADYEFTIDELHGRFAKLIDEVIQTMEDNG